jgi:hypothetical protein
MNGLISTILLTCIATNVFEILSSGNRIFLEVLIMKNNSEANILYVVTSKQTRNMIVLFIEPYYTVFYTEKVAFERYAAANDVMHFHQNTSPVLHFLKLRPIVFNIFRKDFSSIF